MLTFPSPNTGHFGELLRLLLSKTGLVTYMLGSGSGSGSGVGVFTTMDGGGVGTTVS